MNGDGAVVESARRFAAMRKLWVGIAGAIPGVLFVGLWAASVTGDGYVRRTNRADGAVAVGAESGSWELALRSGAVEWRIVSADAESIPALRKALRMSDEIENEVGLLQRQLEEQRLESLSGYLGEGPNGSEYDLLSKIDTGPVSALDRRVVAGRAKAEARYEALTAAEVDRLTALVVGTNFPDGTRKVYAQLLNPSSWRQVTAWRLNPSNPFEGVRARPLFTLLGGVKAASAGDRSIRVSLMGPMVAGILLLWPFALAVRGWRRVAGGLCSGCGYDLRESPCQCPECGTVRAA